MFTPVKDRIEYGGAMIGLEEVKAVMDVMLGQGGKRWTVGPESIAFEQELAKNTGVKRAVVVNSGSSALLVAMTSLNLPKGSRVIIPALNFPTAFNAILQCGCIPYVIDIDPKTLLIDLNEVKKAIELDPDIKAVIAINIASNPVDLKALREIIGDRKIILDNCDGYGTLVNDVYVETLADLSCVSFHAAHIITTGEGGAILTNDEELANKCKKIREWGRADGTDALYNYEGLPGDYRSRYVYEEIGYNMKPLELQCAMGRVQLKRIAGFREQRLANFKALHKVLSKYENLQMMEYPTNTEVCWFSFPMVVWGVQRGVLMDYLEKNNIECRTIFSGNVLRHPAYKDVEFKTNNGDNSITMTNADFIMSNGLFLSVHPSINQDMINFIDKVIGEICK